MTEDAVKSVRPGYGIAPKYLKDVIGKRARKDLWFGKALEFGDWVE